MLYPPTIELDCRPYLIDLRKAVATTRKVIKTPQPKKDSDEGVPLRLGQLLRPETVINEMSELPCTFAGEATDST